MGSAPTLAVGPFLRACLRAGPAALALSATSTSARAQELSVRGGMAWSSGYFCTFGGLGGIALNYRVARYLRVGGYVDGVGLGSCSSDHGFESFQAVRFGPQVEFHPVQEGVLDPWVGAALGPFFRAAPPGVSQTFPQGFGADVGGSLGLDLRVSSRLAVGAMFFVVLPFARDRDVEDRPVGFITSTPFPAIRVVVNVERPAADASGVTPGATHRESR